MRANFYLWTTAVAEFGLTLLGAIVALDVDRTRLYHREILTAFIVIGIVAMVTTAKYAQRSSSEITSLITGGNTFCYFDIIGQQFPPSIGNLRKNGEGPLYNVRMSIQALVPARGGGQLGRGRINATIGDLPASNRPAFHDIPLQAFNLRDEDSVDFHVKLEAKNGYWVQILCLRKVGNQWLRATKVSRVDYGTKLYGQAKPKIVFEETDPAFPCAGINWNENSLLYH